MSFFRMLGKKMGGGIAGNFGAFAIGGAAIDATLTYSGRQAENNESRGKSAAIAGVQAAGWVVAEPLMWGVQAAQMAGGAIGMTTEQAHENKDRYRQMTSSYRDASGERAGSVGGRFEDSEAAATLRQRQMGLMRQHRLATETILGSEARQLHR